MVSRKLSIHHKTKLLSFTKVQRRIRLRLLFVYLFTDLYCFVLHDSSGVQNVTYITAVISDLEIRNVFTTEIFDHIIYALYFT